MDAVVASEGQESNERIEDEKEEVTVLFIVLVLAIVIVHQIESSLNCGFLFQFNKVVELIKLLRFQSNNYLSH